MTVVNVVGGGLAGSEAALVASSAGVKVKLFEMRPHVKTPAHVTDNFAELVCSNSFGSMDPEDGKGLLKAELDLFGSNLITIARGVRVRAGKALAVDRLKFQAAVTDSIFREKNIEVVREEVTSADLGGVTVIATGPLTSEGMARDIVSTLGQDNLSFYDAISPIVEADSLDWGKGFFANRYGNGDDYLNFPMTREEFGVFYSGLIEADTVDAHSFEDESYFESCMPIEILARRGEKTLLFGPMRPVGLIDPANDSMPYSVVQLRRENEEGTMFNMVGFQTRMKIGEQRTVFSLIPGFNKVKFFRFGSIHRNTFINSPSCLLPTLCLKRDGETLLAGQLTGVEGYVESIATGLVAGVNAVRISRGMNPLEFPSGTITGELLGHITTKGKSSFQPMNANFGLLPPPGIPCKKIMRRRIQVERALGEARKFRDLFFKSAPLCDN